MKTITHHPKAKRYKVKRYNQKHKVRKNFGLPAIETLLPIDKSRTVEKKSHSTMRLHGGKLKDQPAEGEGFKGIVEPSEIDEVIFSEKPLHPAGNFGDLFKDENKLEIRNRSGEVVRELKKDGKKVMIHAPTKEEDSSGVEVDTDTEILYEPWTFDAGSLLFQPKENKAPVGMKGQLLKIATEGDDVSPPGYDVHEELNKLGRGELPGKDVKDVLREGGVEEVELSGGPDSGKTKSVDDFDHFNYQIFKIKGKKAIGMWLD